jgi:hypothetical protein
LGFAALAIQLWNDPLFPYYDFDTVWYAVTLVPKTEVVGTALKPYLFPWWPRRWAWASPCGSLGPCAAGVGLASKRCRKAGGRGRWAIYLLVRHRTFLAASREGS